MQEKKNVLYIIYITRSEKIKIFIKKSGKVGLEKYSGLISALIFLAVGIKILIEGII